MASSKRLGLLLAICLGFLAPAVALAADCDVKPGTVITKQNWKQYKDCFTYGEQRLWEGDLFWKMPDDVEIHVGAPHHWTLPKPYVEATEKYGGQARLVKQPNGLYKLDNYVAGLPFPNPSEPDKGTKIAANVTYKMQGYQWGMFQDLGAQPTLFTKDRFGNSAPSLLDFTYNQTAYNWESDKGVPAVNPAARRFSAATLLKTINDTGGTAAWVSLWANGSTTRSCSPWSRWTPRYPPRRPTGTDFSLFPSPRGATGRRATCTLSTSAVPR